MRASTVCKGLTEFGLPHDHTQAPHLLVWSEGPPSPLILRYYWDMTGLPSRVTGSRWDPQKAILDSFVGLEMEPFSKYVSVLSAGRSASSNESSSEDILSAMKYAGSDSDSQGALEQLDDCFILALYRRGEKRIHKVMSVQSFFRVFRNKLGLNAPAKSSTKFGGVR